MRADGRWPSRRATSSQCRPAQATTWSAAMSPAVVRTIGRRAGAHRPEHLGAEQQGGAGALEAPHEGRADRAVVDDPGRGHVQGRDGTDVRLVLPGLLAGEPGDLEPVGEPALVQPREAGQLVLAGGHDELAADLVGDALLLGEGDHRRRAGAAHEGLLRAGRVVEAGVDHPAVAPGLVGGPAVLLLDQGDVGVRVLAAEPLGDGQPDDPAADDEVAHRRRHAPSVDRAGCAAVAERQNRAAGMPVVGGGCQDAAG